MSAERLERVRSFGELRTGMIVVVKGCHICGAAKHRGMLLSRWENQETVDCDGDQDFDAVGFDLAPSPACIPKEGWVITGDTVADGAVYRVGDGLEAPATTHTKRAPARTGGVR